MLLRIKYCAAVLLLFSCRQVIADDVGKPTPQVSKQIAQFDQSVALLLARRCLDCHNATDKKGGLDLSQKAAAMRGGESGRAIVPGRPVQSFLWKRVADDEMPPKKPLTADERKVLKFWIAGGAKWGTDPIDPYRVSTSKRAGYDWWSLQPVERPKIPGVSKTGWIDNPIDAFVLAKLEKAGLEPSPMADRRTMIRRLSFDLIGLPPSPAEIDAFLADSSPNAYERLVDRLLASPHYGERWARHWLDIVRFGESQGFERDKLRPNSWRYRDWVVNAFNSDLPYNQFARRQLAGDVLSPDDPAAAIATGFLVAGPYDEVGQSQQSAAMRAVVRQDDLEDVVSVVGQTFLGLTVNCARCHDHKFDPVRQVEYYRLTAALGCVRHGERNVNQPAIASRSAERDKALKARVDELKRQLSSIDEPARQQILAKRRTKPSTPIVPPQPISRWDFNRNLSNSAGRLQGTAQGTAQLKDNRLHVDGKTGYVATAPIEQDIVEKTLEVWVKLNGLDQRGGGAISLQTLNGGTFDAIVFGERESRRWMAGSNGFQRTQSFSGPEETEADKRLVQFAIVYRKDGTISGYRNGHPYGESYKTSGPVTFKAGQAQLLFGLRHNPPGGNRMLAGVIDRAQLYDKALTPAEVAASAGVKSDYVDQQEILARLNPAQRQQRAAFEFEIAELEDQRSRARVTTSYAVNPRKPDIAHLLKRGNPAQLGEVVSPGGVAALVGVSADFGLPTDGPDAPRRVALARWITHQNNPLFARVIVNRLWHYHFGIGLVDTPSDFGFNGARPTHPELIDWLASELAGHDWSLKAVQRMIVTSAVYRQTSRFESRAAKIDAGNRLLWRKSPLRLDAEIVRDSVLAVSGQLNRAPGGPGYKDFTSFVRNTQFYVPVDAVGQSFNRRSLYRTWVRSGRNRFLDAFDCPDPSTKTPKRAVTTTPLQALSLMNNSFVLRMADRFAERLKREAGDNVAQQLALAYRLTYGRRPLPEETRLTAAFIEQQGLPAFCRVLFNSNEFLHVD